MRSSRIRFRVELAAVVAFLLLLVAVDRRGRLLPACHWQIAVGVGARALRHLRCSTLGAPLHARALGNNDIEFWIISNRIMPPVVAVLPIYVMFQQLRLLDTHIALIATYTAVNLPIVVWLMRDFFAGIPLDLEESAEIDGASQLRIFFTIVAAARPLRASPRPSCWS